jgi:hypothetical protein
LAQQRDKKNNRSLKNNNGKYKKNKIKIKKKKCNGFVEISLTVFREGLLM